MGFGYNIDRSKARRLATESRNYNYRAKKVVDKLDGIKQGKSFKELLKGVLKKKQDTKIRFEE